MAEPPLRSVLIADDEPLMQRAWVRGLRDKVGRAEAVSTVAEALARIAAAPPDLLILDLRLDHESGLALVEPARRAGARVVIVSAWASVAVTVDAMRLGAAAVLTKPVSVDEILAAADPTRPPPPLQLPTLDRLEWEHLQRALALTNGNISEAARRLGLPRRTLQRKLQKRPPAA